jgi:cation transport ATPase
MGDTDFFFDEEDQRPSQLNQKRAEKLAEEARRDKNQSAYYITLTALIAVLFLFLIGFALKIFDGMWAEVLSNAALTGVPITLGILATVLYRMYYIPEQPEAPNGS